jgi:hypothetical protein
MNADVVLLRFRSSCVESIDDFFHVVLIYRLWALSFIFHSSTNALPIECMCALNSLSLQRTFCFWIDEARSIHSFRYRRLCLLWIAARWIEIKRRKALLSENNTIKEKLRSSYISNGLQWVVNWKWSHKSWAESTKCATYPRTNVKWLWSVCAHLRWFVPKSLVFRDRILFLGLIRVIPSRG